MAKTNTLSYIVAFVVIGLAALSFNYFRGPKSMVIAEMDSDASVLDQLKKAGSNLNKPHRPEIRSMTKERSAARTGKNAASSSTAVPARKSKRVLPA